MCSNLHSALTRRPARAAVARAGNSGALMTGIAGIAGNTIGALSSYGQPQVPNYMTPGGGIGGAILPSSSNYGRGW